MPISVPDSYQALYSVITKQGYNLQNSHIWWKLEVFMTGRERGPRRGRLTLNHSARRRLSYDRTSRSHQRGVSFVRCYCTIAGANVSWGISTCIFMNRSDIIISSAQCYLYYNTNLRVWRLCAVAFLAACQWNFFPFEVCMFLQFGGNFLARRIKICLIVVALCHEPLLKALTFCKSSRDFSSGRYS